MPQTVIGFIPIMAGHGFQIIHGDGLLSIMVVGGIIRALVGYGQQIRFGLRLG